MGDGIERFEIAQRKYFFTALEEVQDGKKQSHWMWYVFPQIAGLGYSEMATYYAIQDMKEAQIYMQNLYLRHNLLLICRALLALETNDAKEVFGDIDSLKLHSSVTLFSVCEPQNEIFLQVLAKFFNSTLDGKTIELLKLQ